KTRSRRSDRYATTPGCGKGRGRLSRQHQPRGKSPTNGLRTRSPLSEIRTDSRQKAFATIESTSIYLSNHVVPKWGNASLSDVRTVEVEQWLHSLPYAPA